MKRVCRTVQGANASFSKFAKDCGAFAMHCMKARLAQLEKEERKASFVEAHTAGNGSRERSETSCPCRVLQISIGICEID